jgi:hypothetical protein
MDQINGMIPRVLIGHFVHDNHKVPIQVEYRLLNPTTWEIYSRIAGSVFYKKGTRFFELIADLLDSLPESSSIVFNHAVPVLMNGERSFATLEEWIFPYEVKNSGTVMYKLKLIFADKVYETQTSNDFGGVQGVKGGALEQLRELTKDKFSILVCYFCSFLIEYNEDGGTDYRHDQLYCFRDAPQLLQLIEKVYPRLRGQEHILDKVVPNISSLHSCDAFTHRPDVRS